MTLLDENPVRWKPDDREVFSFDAFVSTMRNEGMAANPMVATMISAMRQLSNFIELAYVPFDAM